MQKEPDFLDKVVDARLSPGPTDVHHPLVGGLVILFSLVRRDVPGREGQSSRRREKRRMLTESSDVVGRWEGREVERGNECGNKRQS